MLMSENRKDQKGRNRKRIIKNTEGKKKKLTKPRISISTRNKDFNNSFKAQQGPEIIDIKRIPVYQNGADGFFKFVEENIRFEIPFRGSQLKKWLYPTELPSEPDSVTGKSFKDFWEKQKEELRPALSMKDGTFKYKLIVLCWPRGEGKSLDVVLVQLWKFFCFPRQIIVFGALSKDQTRFVHYDIAQSIILNSPKLLNIIGKNNVQHGRLFLKNKIGEVTSSIQPISSFSGIVSNITGYTFSEMFDMKDHKFFVQYDGSVRNIHNAIGAIDSTVSTKDHILYKLYKGYKSGGDPLIYFSHRSAPEAKPEEFWHPHMDDKQLQSYKTRWPSVDFDRYLKNSWELDSGKLFNEALVRSIFNYGYIDERRLEFHKDDGGVFKICNEIAESYAKHRKKDTRINREGKRRRRSTKMKEQRRLMKKIASLEARLVSTDSIYKLSEYSMPCCARIDDLMKLSNIFDTNWSIHCGIDRSDPMAQNPQARTIVTAIAKGLTKSRTYHNIEEKEDVPEYIYFLLHLAHITDASLEGIKKELEIVYNEFDGIDTICSERWGAWDLAPWCKNKEIEFEAVFPNYELQKKVFSELFIIIRNARFKSPVVCIPGVKNDNLLQEELEMFDYDTNKKWYGSPQKNEKGGVQDDSVFSLGLGIYGGRNYGIHQFRERTGVPFFGTYIPPDKKGLVSSSARI